MKTIVSKEDGIAAAEFINKELACISDKFIAKAGVQSIIGLVLCVTIVSPYKVTKHNANLLVDLMVHMSDAGNGCVEICNCLAPKALKYRKIKGKNVQEAAEKLVAWVKKKLPEMEQIAQGA